MLISYKLNRCDRTLFKSHLVASECIIYQVSDNIFRVSFKNSGEVQIVFFNDEDGFYLTHGIIFLLFRRNRGLLKIIEKAALSIEPDQVAK